jgi:hypothetical protein
VGRLRPVHPIALLVCFALALSACGGSGSDRGSTGGSEHAAAPPRIHQKPRALVRKVAATLRRVRSFHFAGFVDNRDGHLVMSGDVTRDGDVRMVERLDNLKLTIIRADAQLYFRANAAFWDRYVAPAAVRLGGRWINAPAQLKGQLSGEFDDLRPERLAACLAEPTGTLRYRGVLTVDGKQAILIEDRGDRPGTAPGVLYVQAHGRPLPLRVIQTGPERKGGHTDRRCNDSPGNRETSSDIRLSRFDHHVTIEAPKGALDLGSLGAGRTA